MEAPQNCLLPKGAIDPMGFFDWLMGKPKTGGIEVVSRYGPVGVLGLRFPGCVVWVKEIGDYYIKVAVAGGSTHKTALVPSGNWNAADVAQALEADGMHPWHNGDFRDARRRSSSRGAPPLKQSAFDPIDFKQVFP